MKRKNRNKHDPRNSNNFKRFTFRILTDFLLIRRELKWVVIERSN